MPPPNEGRTRWLTPFGARKSAVADGGAFDGDDVGMPRSTGGSSMLVFTGPPKCSGTTAPAIACVVPSTAVHVPMVISAPAPTAADINLNLLYFTVDHFQIDLVSRPLSERTLLRTETIGQALICVV